MTDTPDTILAVSTPAGYSPRAILRLSGPEALACVAERFHADGDYGDWRRTFSATRGRLHLAEADAQVPALVYVMRAPRSYTREDVVELHVPGCPALLDMLLDEFLSGGAGALRLAQPGEFTRRAMLNGRIDLAQAEAVLALIRARSDSELAAAAARLGGGVSRRCAELQDQIAELRAQVEAALDFAQHGIELIGAGEVMERCASLRRTILEEVSAGRGELASRGAVTVAICGAPNAGKSSLLNRLAGSERAIVHPTAGTTRDAVTAQLRAEGVTFNLLDSAGLARRPAGPDAEAVRRSRVGAATSDLIMLVIDGSVPLPQDALEIAEGVDAARLLCVINKSDLPRVVEEEHLRRMGLECEMLHASALTGEGVDRLRDMLWRVVAEGRLDASAADCLFNARQRSALGRAAEEIEEGERAVRDDLGYEFAALNLREASEALGEVTGRVTSQDVLDRIFSRFCIGK